jgi:predicted CxxxxCH...CXXCH cytochrome family protein
MSQIILKAGGVLSSAMLILSIGCSDARTPKSLINTDTGKHDAGWASPDSHGAVAKAAAGSTSGFAVCQECHADKFNGGISNISCLNTAGCHGAAVSSPHSPKPWRGGTRTHTNTDQSNAPICALCHTNGANSSVQPSPFDSGAAPGCFNNTLCHAAVGHPAGWADPSAHGTTAKSAPTSTAGFSYCQTCHGSDFTGGTANQSCFTCHQAGSTGTPPHAFPWLPGDTYVHTTTDQGNAPVCALCHLNNRTPPSYATVPAGTTPDCFNNTLCHGAVGHAAGWANPNSHGAAAKSAPGTATGFSYCQSCHGNDFTGGTVNQSCFTCHQAGTTGTPPHAFPWLPGDTYVHTTTDQGNAPVCGLCHLGNRQPPAYVTLSQTVGCFDNTLCHATPTCGTCHAIPPNGAVSPNVAGQHAPHIAVSTIIVCATCHTGAGYGTALHQNGNVDVIIDPTYNAKSGAASYNSTNNTCTTVSCHGGQTTPGWLSGTVIDVNTQCTSCHASGTAQYNSYHSGHHQNHVVDEGIACYTCHDTTLLAVNHFTSLNTSALEGPASATIKTAFNYSNGSCSPGCHGTRTW